MSKFWAKYGKLITGAIGALLSVGATDFGSTPWYGVVVALATALGIYYAPHQVTK